MLESIIKYILVDHEYFFAIITIRILIENEDSIPKIFEIFSVKDCVVLERYGTFEATRKTLTLDQLKKFNLFYHPLFLCE